MMVADLNIIGVSSMYSFVVQVQNDYSLQHLLSNYIFLFISLFGIIVGGYLFFPPKKEKSNAPFLGIFIFSLALVLLELTLFWWNGITYKPKIPFYKILLFIWGPSFYLYFRFKSTPDDPPPAKSRIAHFGIFFLSLILFIVLGNSGFNAQNWWFQTGIEFLNNIWIKVIYFSIYLFAMLFKLNKNRRNLSIQDKNWLNALIVFFSLLVLISAFRAEFYRIHSYDVLTKYFAAFILSGFIAVSGILLFLFPEFLTKPAPEVIRKENSNTKYKNSGLTEDMTESLKHKLTERMTIKKLYLDPTLNLDKLAVALNTDRYSVSQVVNQEYGKNFYEFINDFRIAECIQIIKTDRDKIELVDDLIYECGFNNRVSFYKAFKDRNGMTPLKYLKAFDGEHSPIS